MQSFISFIEQLVELGAALAWPATVLAVLYYLRDPAGDLLQALADRIKDPRSEVSIGREGLAIKSRLEALEIDQEQTKSLTLQALGVSERGMQEPGTQSIELDADLLRLADDYLAIDDPSWSKRVRLKDAAAMQMADLVITRNIPRQLMAQQQHEGIILALAAASHALPTADDTELLVQVAGEAQRLHVRYRILMAIGRLIERGLVDSDQADAIGHVLQSYKRGADVSLRNRLAYTENLIKAAAQPGA
ncbi:hypothetical protein [Marinobacterium rhizophilum]|uniref:Uncharacterized protein n=1 Tax=Marinobacterium rhizophilum TaxID=420402 RepID=A0ABY5HH30_9GAMM|nr:hypothetical protein [Marinobacterium rhizophilum]UTW11667.1 hypothetical protein KDW95_20830 [Marinobacterium rhizophilum]